MKARKIFPVFLILVLLMAQFSLVGNISAATSALNGRTDFAMGVNIHRAQNYVAYKNQLRAISDAAALGSNFIRTNSSTNNSYDYSVVKLAAKKGMQVMMVVGISCWDSTNKTAIPASDIDIDGLTTRFTGLATDLRGKVAYYQLGNELCNKYIKGNTAGKNASEFNDVSGAAVAIYAVNNAIKAADPNAKTVLNFSWFHYGFIAAVKAVDIDSRTGRLATSSTPSEYITHADFDIVGMDWYAGGGVPENSYVNIIDHLTSTYPEKNVIVCEANIVAKSSTDGETVVYNATPSWIENFAIYCYGNSRVEGFFVYELYDEPVYANSSGTYAFDKESHFGLIDKYGNKKDVYETVRALYDGTGVSSGMRTPDVIDLGESSLKFSSGEIALGRYDSAAINNAGFPGWSSYSSSFVQFTNEKNLTVYDYVEFDYYVDNLENIQSRGMALTVGIMHYSGGAVRYADFTSYLTENGWNHVRVPITVFSGDSSISDRAKQIRFRITMPASEIGANDVYVIANICATIDQIDNIPAINNTYVTVDSIAGVNHTMTLSPGENPYPDKGYFRLSKTLNTAIGDHIEMDIYLTQPMDKYASFWVSSNREAAKNRGKYRIPQLKSGWNHVVLDANTNIDTYGSYSFKDYNFKFPYFENTFFSSSHLTGGTVRVANISVTCNVAAPTDIMSDNTAFISETLKSVTFGSNGNYDFEFSSSKDISDTKMIELDTYITDSGFNGVTFLVTDTDGNYADYEFTDLTTGWNHLAVRIADLIPGNENTKPVDFEKIAKVTLGGIADANITVSNLYAADYVEGDANRDGVFDIRDIVRAKKMAAGVTTVGNKLAVAGSDYNIKAVDLVRLIRSMINKLFK